MRLTPVHLSNSLDTTPTDWDGGGGLGRRGRAGAERTGGGARGSSSTGSGDDPAMYTSLCHFIT